MSRNVDLTLCAEERAFEFGGENDGVRVMRFVDFGKLLAAGVRGEKSSRPKRSTTLTEKSGAPGSGRVNRTRVVSGCCPKMGSGVPKRPSLLMVPSALAGNEKASKKYQKMVAERDKKQPQREPGTSRPPCTSSMARGR